MKPRQRKSRKRSAASSTGAPKQLEGVVFYLDESIYSQILVQLMRAEGATVEHAGQAFPRGTEDQVWLTEAGAKRWLVLTRDQRIRFRLLERAALEKAGVGAFVFTAGEATGAETADVVIGLLRKMANMATSEPRPFLYTFGLSGALSRARIRRAKSR